MEASEGYSTEELARCRETAKRLLQGVAERLLGRPRNEPDGLIFDWEIPPLTNPTLATFIAAVHCQGDKSKLRFQIDIAKLQTAGRTADLERLSNILSARHAGIHDRRSLLDSLEWMLTISLEQTAPEFNLNERCLQARRLLFLPEPPPEKSATPLVIGISPLLICVRQRARNRLWKNHHIDIGELERESVQLYVGLEQFEEVPPKPDFRTRADAYTEKLIAHHQRVKQVGKLLGGQLGDALVTLADLAIEWLLKSPSKTSRPG
jgi:hypothetical protein